MELMGKTFSSNQGSEGSNPYPECIQKESRVSFLLHPGEVKLDRYSKTPITSPILSPVRSISS